MLSQISTSVEAYGRALSYLGKPGYARYLLVPILVNILLLAGIITMAVIYAAPLIDYLMAQVQIEPDSWIDFISPLLVVVLTGIVIIGYLLVYKYLVLTLISPFLALLSEKIEEEQTGREFPFSWSQLFRDLGRAAAINFRNFVLEFIATIIFAIFTFIPLIGLLSPVALLLVQSYFFGFALMDFNAERHRLSRRSTESWMRRNFWSVSGVGVIFHFIFLIPVIGWFLAPVWSSVAGTLVWLELEDGRKSISRA